MAAKRWLHPERPPTGFLSPAGAFSLSAAVQECIRCLLEARGVEGDGARGRFLEPSLDHLHDPGLMPDIQPAVERLARAVREGEKILVHGDYDVDGVCSTALLTRVLRVLKANVTPFVPHRREHGYDLRVDTVEKAAEDGVRLILTADCGIVAFEAAARAKELGVDLIITDHHEPSPDGELPDALAVINPHRPDSDYPFPELCGTGVAYKVADALVREMGLETKAFRTAFLDLVALATCADCMPLLDENRVFVRYGLETLRKTNKLGLQALMSVASLRPETLNVRSIGFALGPRINAVGRMDAADDALQLLLTGDPETAATLAGRLDQANRDRQQEQERIHQDAIRHAERFNDDRILVLASHKWHPGIIGIVAGRLAESLCRPTVLIALDEETGMGRGSCRSIEGFHIFEALQESRGLLDRCGGHRAAAGFSIHQDNVEALRAALQLYAATELSDDLLEPTVRIDLELPADALQLDLARQIALLEPHGHGNHQPIFMTRNLAITEKRRLAGKGAQGSDHLKLILETPGNARGTEAMFWRSWGRESECPIGGRVDVCYNVEVNDYNDRQSLQLIVKDIRPAE